MIVHTPPGDVALQPSTQEQEVLHWTADGVSLVLGFMATGSYSGLFRMLVNGDPWYTFQTSTTIRSAYVADRAVRLNAGDVVSIVVQHDSTAVETFSATILGGRE